MIEKTDTKTGKLVIWFSSVLRWSLGSLFMVMGCIYSKDESTWALILFGMIIIATGFFRPKHCLGEKGC